MKGYAYLLVSSVFVISLYGLWLRLLMGVMKVSEENAIYHQLKSWTDILLKPSAFIFRKWRLGRVEVSCLFTLLCFELIQSYLLPGWFFMRWLPLAPAGFLVLGDTIIYVLNLFFFAMLMRLLGAWMGASSASPMSQAVSQLTAPFIRYSKDIFPVMGGYDVAPFFWMVAFKVVAFLVYASLITSL